MLQTAQIPKQKIDELCRKYGVKELDLISDDFRREYGNGEDADLLVEYFPETKTTISDFVDLEEDLKHALGKNLVLISKRGVRPELKDLIIKDRQLLYAS